METWLPAIFGLAGVLIGSFFSLWLTKLQLKNSDKRFDKELVKAREDAQRQRKWEVRSLPLLELRKALARTVSKQDRYAGEIYLAQVPSILGNEEEAMKKFNKAHDDLKASSSGEELTLTLGMLGDRELVQKVRDIWMDYVQKSLGPVMVYQDKAKSSEAIKNFENIRTNIAEVQELINKRLEEL